MVPVWGNLGRPHDRENWLSEFESGDPIPRSEAARVVRFGKFRTPLCRFPYRRPGNRLFTSGFRVDLHPSPF